MIYNGLEGDRNIAYSVVILLLLSTASTSFPETLKIGESSEQNKPLVAECQFHTIWSIRRLRLIVGKAVATGNSHIVVYSREALPFKIL